MKRKFLLFVFLCLPSLLVDVSYAGSLNDTGIATCGDASGNNVACPVNDYPGQDAEYGRDALAKSGLLKKKGAGRAGFDFTKLDSKGKDLPYDAAQWNCIRDNVTGFVWENKTSDGGLRDGNNTYTWYNPKNTANGGYSGVVNGGSCLKSECDTYAYAQAINKLKLCGFKDWRLPLREELISIVDRGISYPGPVIDTNYFANTKNELFWSASPYPGDSYLEWTVNFYYGVDSYEYKGNANHIRLVRGGGL